MVSSLAGPGLSLGAIRPIIVVLIPGRSEQPRDALGHSFDTTALRGQSEEAWAASWKTHPWHSRTVSQRFRVAGAIPDDALTTYSPCATPFRFFQPWPPACRSPHSPSCRQRRPERQRLRSLPLLAIFIVVIEVDLLPALAARGQVQSAVATD